MDSYQHSNMSPDDMQILPDFDVEDYPDFVMDEVDDPNWPPTLPKREALDFLEQALTDHVPRPDYDADLGRPVLPNGRRNVEQSFTLPLDVPQVAQSTVEMDVVWDAASSIPEPHVQTVCPRDLLLVPEDGLEVAAAGDPNDQDDVDHPAQAANEMAPPRGPVSRPKQRGILRKERPSHASASSPANGENGVGKRKRSASGAKRAVKFQLHEGEGDLAQPEVVEARPKRIIKIKSRAAVLYLRELEKKE